MQCLVGSYRLQGSLQLKYQSIKASWLHTMKPKIPTRNTFEKQFHNTRWTIEFSSTTTHNRHTTVDPWKELCKPSSWVRYIASGIDCRQNHNFFTAVQCHVIHLRPPPTLGRCYNSLSSIYMRINFTVVTWDYGSFCTPKLGSTLVVLFSAMCNFSEHLCRHCVATNIPATATIRCYIRCLI
jgi:hypothetical protein